MEVVGEGTMVDQGDTYMAPQGVEMVGEGTRVDQGDTHCTTSQGVEMVETSPVESDKGKPSRDIEEWASRAQDRVSFLGA